MGIGTIMSQQDVLKADSTTVNRETLGLPPSPVPQDMEKFMNVVMATAMEMLG